MRLTNRVRFGSRELYPTVARERCLRATIWLIAGMTQMAPRVRLARLPFAVVALDRASTELAAATCSPPLVVFLGTCTLPLGVVQENDANWHWYKSTVRLVTKPD